MDPCGTTYQRKYFAALFAIVPLWPNYLPEPISNGGYDPGLRLKELSIRRSIRTDHPRVVARRLSTGMKYGVTVNYASARYPLYGNGTSQALSLTTAFFT